MSGDDPRLLAGDVLDPPGYDYEAEMARQLREAGVRKEKPAPEPKTDEWPVRKVKEPPKR